MASPSTVMAERQEYSKPVPQLLPKPSGPWARVRDLAWFARLSAVAAPVPNSLWFLIELTGGLMVPAEMWLTQAFVDSLAARIAGTGEGRPFLLLALLLSIHFVQYALIGVRPWLDRAVREQVGIQIQERVMRKAAGLDLVTFEHQAYYDMVSRVMADAERRGMETLQQVFGLARTIPSLATYVFTLASLAPVLIPIAILALIPLVVRSMRSGMNAWTVLREQTRDLRLSGYYSQILTDRRFAKEVRIYGLARYLLERWDTLFWRTRTEQRRLALRLGLQGRTMVLFVDAVMWTAALWILLSRLTQLSPGQFTLLFRALGGMWTMTSLIWSARALAELSGYASELRAFFALPAEPVFEDEVARDIANHPRLRPFPRPLKGGIRFEGVWFTYPGSERPALADVNLEIGPGEKVALVGVNGAGKSTLVKLLLGIYRPDRGRITFDGIDVRDLDPASLRRSVAAVFQGYLKAQLTLRENIMLGQPELLDDPFSLEAAERLNRAVARAGAEPIVRHLSDGFDTLLGPDVGGTDLSGGQWQRIAIARAFFREAELLILDEPTAALDPLAELALFERFAELAAGHTALLISHRLGMARLANRVLVLDGGRLVEEGTHQVLLDRDGLYASLFEAQRRWYV